jgi:ABC-type sugar transport system permease subunit
MFRKIVYPILLFTLSLLLLTGCAETGNSLTPTHLTEESESDTLITEITDFTQENEIEADGQEMSTLGIVIAVIVIIIIIGIFCSLSGKGGAG